MASLGRCRARERLVQRTTARTSPGSIITASPFTPTPARRASSDFSMLRARRGPVKCSRVASLLRFNEPTFTPRCRGAADKPLLELRWADLFLDSMSPTATSPQFKDSSALNFAGSK